MNEPIICFGQQPCGFFPKRFLVAKINTARALQKEIGGKIVFFYHDSDADYRETITLMKDISTGVDVRLNFTQENKIQKKHSPLYAKRIPTGWNEEILKQLPRVLPPLPPGEGRGEGSLIDIFKSVNEKFVADFCLQMYKKMGLLEGMEIIRSSDKNTRLKAPDIKEGFADVDYQGEIVRAKIEADKLTLHEGGDVYTNLPKPDKISKEQINPARDERFFWMQSLIHCTHYIVGGGEKQYLDTKPFPEVKFVNREPVENHDYAWINN